MHELSVTESILQIAQNHAVAANAQKVNDIYLVIGQLSSIVDDSVQFYWEILTEGTICEKSKLHFSRIQARMQCLACDKEFAIESHLIPCPNCGSFNVKIIAGEEFFVESIDVEI